MAKVDYSEVQSMIRTARTASREETLVEIRSLSNEVFEEIDELRERIESMQRILDQRTENLA